MGKFLMDANERCFGRELAGRCAIKGFRNKNIHGLIDWQLGIDSFCFTHANFVYGFQQLSVALSSVNGSWAARAIEAASILAAALGEAESSVCNWLMTRRL